MATNLELFLKPWVGVTFPETLLWEDEVIEVVSYDHGTVVLKINEDLSIKQHIQAVAQVVPGDTEILREAPFGHFLTGKAPKVWDSIFKKPEPVFGMEAWLQSAESDSYTYYPNDLLRNGPDAELYIQNARINAVLVNAYTTMCNQVGISPKAKLVDGTTVCVKSLKPIDGLQHKLEGERSARLANSELDIDDSMYAAAFLEALYGLMPFDYDNGVVLHTIQAKVENILLGKTDKVSNIRFIQRFLAAARVGESVAVVNIISSMCDEGFILEESIKDFGIRLLKQNIDKEDAEDFLAIYRGCCG